MENKKVYQKKLLCWLVIILLLFSLMLIVSVSVLVYVLTYQKGGQNNFKKQQEIAKLEIQLKEIQEFRDQVQQAYELQNSQFTSTVELADNSVVHSFFTDLLTTYAEKFAKSKGLDTCSAPLQFEGFHLDPNTGNGSGSMGRCFIEDIIYPSKQKTVYISLNQLYLLNKFGLNRFFTTPQGDYIDISFDKMIGTCSHELAHYLQFVKWGRSSCESDLVLNNGNYSSELVKEHKEFREEIYGMIKGEHSPDTFNKGLEFAEWERRWEEI